MALEDSFLGRFLPNGRINANIRPTDKIAKNGRIAKNVRKGVL